MRKRVITALFLVILLAAVLGSLAYRHLHKKSAATLAAKESAATEQEGAGETPSDEAGAEAKAPVVAENRPIIGILLPQLQSDVNWVQDKEVLQRTLMEKGYMVRTMYAGNDPSVQASQLRLLISQKVKALIIAPVDSESLIGGLARAKDAGIGIFSYESLLMDTPAIHYFLTFDRRQVAAQMAAELVKRFGMTVPAEGEHPCYSFECVFGKKSLEDLFLFVALLEELSPYLQEGWLTCPSGRLTYEQVSLSEDQTLQDSLAALPGFDKGSGEPLPDILITGDCQDALTVCQDLQKLGAREKGTWPFLATVGADIETMKALSREEISLTCFLDDRSLASTCAEAVDVYLKGEDPEVSNYAQYDNGVRLVKAITVDALAIDPSNYRLLIDNGYFSETDVFPFGWAPSPTPTSEPETSAR